MAPSTNGRNGRGQFAKGNPGGPGNPYARRAARLRSALLQTVTPEDIRAAVKALIAKAKAGDLAAIRELMDRAIGKPPQAVTVEALLAESNKVDVRQYFHPLQDDEFRRWLTDCVTTGKATLEQLAAHNFDPAYVDFCVGRIAKVDTLADVDRVPATFDPRFADRLRKLAMMEEDAKQVVEVRFVDDWYGSAAANRAATKAIGSS